MLLLVSLFVGEQSLRRFDQLGRSIDVILRENYRSVIACQQMKDALERVDSGALFVLAGFSQQGLAQISKNLGRFRAELAIEMNNLTLPQEPREARTLAALFDRYQKKVEIFLNLRPADASRLYFAELFPLFLDIKNKADTILHMNQQNMNDANDRARAKAAKARRDTYLLLAVSLLFAALFLRFSNRWILRPIQRLIASTMEIRKGNLNMMIRVDTQDEIGQLSEAFNAMLSSLRLFRRSDQARLARIQQATQEAFRVIPEAIAVLDTDGTVEIASESARRDFGLGSGSRIAANPNPWLARLAEEVPKQTSSAREKRHEVVQHFVNNQERFILPKLMPLHDYDQNPIGLILILEDVTLLRQSDEIKRDLFSTVSHQLKTPLTSILMALHLLLEEKVGVLSEQQADLIVSARDECQRLSGIIEDLLDISRIEAGYVRMNFVQVPARTLVEGSLEPFRREAQEKGVVFETEIAADLPQVRADPSRIRHVFANLLSNAVKYTSAGGRIRVTAAVKAGQVAFRVSDSGVGIPEKYQARVFEKFFRVPEQPVQSGEGLGLTIAREIIRAHEGRIGFESGEGRGATFEFTLPIMKQTCPQENECQT